MMSGPATRDFPRTTCRMKLPWWTISLRLRPSTPRQARQRQLMSSEISRCRSLKCSNARLKEARSARAHAANVEPELARSRAEGLERPIERVQKPPVSRFRLVRGQREDRVALQL